MATTKQHAVLFCGRAGSGKTTSAEALTIRGFVELTLAAPIKTMSMELVHYFYPELREKITLDYFYDPTLKESPVEGYEFFDGPLTTRRVMQIVGTEIGRKFFGEDVWINALLEDARQAFAQGKSVVITDVRFPNEAAYLPLRLRSLGFDVTFIRIIRPGQFSKTPVHASEASVDKLPVDLEIINNGSVEDLHARVLATVL